MDSLLKTILYRINNLNIEKDSSKIELEFRIGFINKNFNSNISEIFFYKLKNVLEKSKFFKNCECEIFNDYFNEKNRLSILKKEDKEERICIRKEKLISFDIELKNTPIDFRICLSYEKPIDEKEFLNCEKKTKETFDKIEKTRRNKKRYTFLYKYWRYDFSIVNKDIFEVELELNQNFEEVLKKKNLNYIIHSGILKIKDICCILEEEENINFNPKIYRIIEY